MAASALAIALAALVLLPHGGLAIDATKERLIRREAFEVKDSSGEVRIGSKGDMMRGERKRESNSLQPMETQHDVEGTTPSTHTDLCAKSFYNMKTDGVFTEAEDCHAPPYPSTGSDKRSLSESDCQIYATEKGQSTPITVFGQPLCGNSVFDDNVAISNEIQAKTAPLGCFEHDGKYFFNSCEASTRLGEATDFTKFAPICERKKYKKGNQITDLTTDGTCPTGYEKIAPPASGTQAEKDAAYEAECKNEVACYSEEAAAGRIDDQFRVGLTTASDKYTHPCGCFYEVENGEDKVRLNTRTCEAGQIPAGQSVNLESTTTFTPICIASAGVHHQPTATTTTTTAA